MIAKLNHNYQQTFNNAERDESEHILSLHH